MAAATRAPYQVHLNIYDVQSNGSDNVSALITKINKLGRDLGIGGVFHGAIQIANFEWSFGWCEKGSGVYVVEARKNPLYHFRETVDLGTTAKTKQEIKAILCALKHEWQGPTYELLSKNCCHFCQAFSTALAVKPIPGWVNRFAISADATVSFTHEALAMARNVTHSICNTAASSLGWLCENMGRMVRTSLNGQHSGQHAASTHSQGDAHNAGSVDVTLHRPHSVHHAQHQGTPQSQAVSISMPLPQISQGDLAPASASGSLLVHCVPPQHDPTAHYALLPASDTPPGGSCTDDDDDCARNCSSAANSGAVTPLNPHQAHRLPPLGPGLSSLHHAPTAPGHGTNGCAPAGGSPLAGSVLQHAQHAADSLQRVSPQPQHVLGLRLGIGSCLAAGREAMAEAAAAKAARASRGALPSSSPELWLAAAATAAGGPEAAGMAGTRGLGSRDVVAGGWGAAPPPPLLLQGTGDGPMDNEALLEWQASGRGASPPHALCGNTGSASALEVDAGKPLMPTMVQRSHSVDHVPHPLPAPPLHRLNVLMRQEAAAAAAAAGNTHPSDAPADALHHHQRSLSQQHGTPGPAASAAAAAAAEPRRRHGGGRQALAVKRSVRELFTGRLLRHSMPGASLQPGGGGGWHLLPSGSVGKGMVREGREKDRDRSGQGKEDAVVAHGGGGRDKDRDKDKSKDKDRREGLSLFFFRSPTKQDKAAQQRQQQERAGGWEEGGSHGRRHNCAGQGHGHHLFGRSSDSNVTFQAGAGEPVFARMAVAGVWQYKEDLVGGFLDSDSGESEAHEWGLQGRRLGAGNGGSDNFFARDGLRGPDHKACLCMESSAWLLDGDTHFARSAAATAAAATSHHAATRSATEVPSFSRAALPAPGSGVAALGQPLLELAAYHGLPSMARSTFTPDRFTPTLVTSALVETPATPRCQAADEVTIISSIHATVPAPSQLPDLLLTDGRETLTSHNYDAAAALPPTPLPVGIAQSRSGGGAAAVGGASASVQASGGSCNGELILLEDELAREAFLLRVAAQAAPSEAAKCASSASGSASVAHAGAGMGVLQGQGGEAPVPQVPPAMHAAAAQCGGMGELAGQDEEVVNDTVATLDATSSLLINGTTSFQTQPDLDHLRSTLLFRCVSFTAGFGSKEELLPPEPLLARSLWASRAGRSSGAGGQTLPLSPCPSFPTVKHLLVSPEW